MHLTLTRAFVLTIGMSACRADSPPRRTPAPSVTTATVSSPAAESAAVEQVRRRFSAHFAGQQGFGVDTLRARRTWFTPCLYSMLLADMDANSTRGDVGYLNWDPFAAAQDDAAGFHIERAESGHDSVLVHLRIDYPGSVASTAMTVAVTDVDGQWRIANIVTQQANLARGLDSSLRADSTTPSQAFAACRQP
jgi:hypothetical protein